MADKTNTSQAARSAPAADSPAAVRNVVLVGPSGAGKTTLVEALLVASGVLSRAGVRGRRQHGVRFRRRGDPPTTIRRARTGTHSARGHQGQPDRHPPGYADFVGELRAGLRAAECALFVIAANEGVDEATKALWHECDDVGMPPRAVVITKLDHARANYDTALRAAQDAFGEKVLPLYLPIEKGGLVGLLSRSQYDYRDGTRSVHPPDDAHTDRIAEHRGTLIEGIIEESEDESLMERYLGGEVIDEAVLIDDLEKAVARGSFFPVIPVCSGTGGVGTVELLDVATRGGFPSPLEHVLPEVYNPHGGWPVRGGCPAIRTGRCWPRWSRRRRTPTSAGSAWSGCSPAPSGPTRQCMCRAIFSAFFEANTHADHDEDERIGTLSFPLGKQQRPATQVVAGDICAIGRLTRAETGDTLSDKADPLLLKPWTMPEPLLPVAIAARAKTDEDKLSVGLQRLAAEDPTLRIEQNAETHQIVLWCMGEAHSSVVLEALANRYGVNVDTIEVRIPLRETFGGSAKGHGRHVKQSGGHGQFAVCDIEVEPLPGGSGFEFVDKVVGGAVPRQFIPSVEKGGVRAQMERGVHAGYPVVDIRVTLVDGKAHSVDSSDMAFQMAGGLALREAAAQTRIDLLEPVDEVTINVPDDLVGAVMGDLSGRRGRVLGTEQASENHTLIRAEVPPQVELTRYAIDMRSLTHGAASFTRSFARYEPMPETAAAKVQT